MATISHEVKTPLTVLKSQIDAFTDGIHEPTEDRLIKCKDEILRLEGMMARMEDYESLTQAGYILNLSDFYVDDELKSLMMILKPQFDKKQLTLEMKSDDKTKIRTDLNKFRQVMYNLLSNAYKFSTEGTSIHICLGITKDDIVIDVMNQGLVVEEKDRQTIFERNYRAESARHVDPYGKGLGLYISRDLAEFIGGSLQMIRSDVDGTVFRLQIKNLID